MTSTRQSSWLRESRQRPWEERSRSAPSWSDKGLIEQAFRDHWGYVLAALIGFLGDFDLAEEAAQEAFATAAERWPRDGVPANPGAWLITTARNRAIDRIRRERTLADKTRLLEVRTKRSTTWTRRPSQMSVSSCFSPAVIPRSEPTHRWPSPCVRSVG